MAAVAGGGGAARALSQREQDIQMMLAADVHLGTKNCDFQMERYVFKRRTDGSGGARVRPNMLVTGTPGTGKTTTCSLLADATGLRHVNIGDLVREKGLHDGWDEDLDCHIINEDMVCDELEDMMKEGGILVDYHGCEFFPKRWFDLVVVLQTDNSILHDRLTSRGYMGAKLANNIECEIFQVLLEEARESYKEEIVMPLRSDNVEDVSRNVGTLTEWINNWRPPRSLRGTLALPAAFAPQEAVGQLKAAMATLETDPPASSSGIIRIEDSRCRFGSEGTPSSGCTRRARCPAAASQPGRRCPIGRPSPAAATALMAPASRSNGSSQ